MIHWTSINQLPRTLGYYYLATPYSKWPHGLEDANHVAQMLAAQLIAAKVPVYSPIAHTHGIAIRAGMDPLDHTLWMPADQPLFNGAYGLLVAELTGWAQSKGVAMEIEWAKLQKKPMHLLDATTLEFRPLRV